MNGPNPSDPATRTAGDLPSTAGPDRTGTYDPDRTPPANSATPPLGPPAANGAGRSPDDASGRYQVVGPHKRGGLGQVWLAWDTLAERTVALKTIRPDRTGSDNLVKRFAREAKVTGQLEHPGIVPVYDLGEREGEPHYVMRFVRGRTLSEAAQEFHGSLKPGPAGRPTLRDLLDRFLGVCHAIAFAHDRGYLHRDLKGSNIILGDFHEVFVLDWGLVKKIGEPDRPGDPTPLSPALDEPQTRTGAVLGTPEYMAPEVAAKQPATTASDVYGLGAVLYHILTGHPPVEGTTPQEVLSKLTDGVSIPAPRALNPTAPPALEAIARKALAPKPADRYPSATALADDVRRWLADEPVTAYPEPWPTRVARWARRHRTGATAAAVALVLTAAGSAVAAGLIWQEKEETAKQKQAAEVALGVAEQEKERAEQNYAVAWGLTSNVTDLVIQNETGRVGRRLDPAEQAKLLTNAVDAVEKLLEARPDDPDLMARTAMLLRFAGRLAGRTNAMQTAERSLARSVRLQEQLHQRMPGDQDRRLNLALTLQDYATHAVNVGQLTVGLNRLHNANSLIDGLDSADAARPDARRVLGLVLTERASTEYWLGKWDKAIATGDRAADLFAGLASSPPNAAHFLDPVFGGMARTSAAKARREKEQAAGGKDHRAALVAHAAAVKALRDIASRDPNPDVMHNLYRAVIEQARTRLLTTEPPASVLADLNEAVDGWRKLDRENRRLPMYRHYLAVGLTVRGQAWASAEPTNRKPAAVDFKEATDLLESLARASLSDASYRADLGAAWAGLAAISVATDRKVAEVYYYRGWKSYEKATEIDPENSVYKAAMGNLLEKAKNDGFDAKKRP
ncbi:MAG: protein kinase [Gemmataceae bacterium]